MAGQQGRVAFQSEVMFDAGPHFRVLLRGQRHQARDQSLQNGALLHGKRRFAGGGSAPKVAEISRLEQEHIRNAAAQ